MPRLYRPTIPVEVRCRVALRQLGEMWPDQALRAWLEINRGLRSFLDLKLSQLAELLGCADTDLRLDHDPALGARQIVPVRRPKKDHRWFNSFGVALRYEPNANDPKFLIYRTKAEHDVKTRIRGEHGQYRDLALIKRARKATRKRRPKQKIRSRGFRKIAKKRRRQLPLPPRRTT